MFYIILDEQKHFSMEMWLNCVKFLSLVYNFTLFFGNETWRQFTSCTVLVACVLFTLGCIKYSYLHIFHVLNWWWTCTFMKSYDPCHMSYINPWDLDHVTTKNECFHLGAFEQISSWLYLYLYHEIIHKKKWERKSMWFG